MKTKHSEDTLESMSQAVWYNQWTLHLFDKYLQGKILEVGCGIGNFTKTLTTYGKVVAIDINPDYVEGTKNLVGDRASVGVGDIEKGEYFFKHNGFDSIVCLNVLEHIKDDKKTIKNLYALIKKGGYLILLVPSHPLLYGEIDRSIGHFRRYNKKDLEVAVKKMNFKVVKIKRLNFLGAIGWWFAAKIFKDNRVSPGKIKIFNLIAPPFLILENAVEPIIGTSILLIARK